MLTMNKLNLNGKRVLIRVDLNVPLEDGHITSDARIRAVLPTIQQALKAGALVILMSHLGRPKEGEDDPAFSLAPIAHSLSEHLKHPVRLEKDWINGIHFQSNEIILAENVRFLKGEEKNDPSLAKKMAALCDVFVMDAFATAHRAQASTTGVAHYAKIACAGPLLIAELDALTRVMNHPKKPVMALVGGSKVSTKLGVLESLSKKMDAIFVGGGILNTFIAAQGFPVGKSLYEPDFIPTAKTLLQHTAIPIPIDVVVAKEFSKTATATVKTLNDVSKDDLILDIGPETAQDWANIIAEAKTILWNGPVGVFEFPQFGHGTETIAHAIANSTAFSVAGGGDTLAAIDRYGLTDQISYISTGGGAFLEFIEGRTLPAVLALENRE